MQQQYLKIPPSCSQGIFDIIIYMIKWQNGGIPGFNSALILPQSASDVHFKNLEILTRSISYLLKNKYDIASQYINKRPSEDKFGFHSKFNNNFEILKWFQTYQKDDNLKFQGIICQFFHLLRQHAIHPYYFAYLSGNNMLTIN